MGSRRCKESAEGQGVSCHDNGEIVGQGGDDRGRAWRPVMEAGHGDRTWRQGMETGDGGRAWRQGMEAGNGDKERAESQEVSRRSLPLKCSNVRSVSR